MIENCVAIIHGRRLKDPVPMDTLIEGLEPMGLFEGIELLGVDTELFDLFQTVLVDTPVGKYFE